VITPIPPKFSFMFPDLTESCFPFPVCCRIHFAQCFHENRSRTEKRQEKAKKTQKMAQIHRKTAKNSGK